MNIQSHLFVLVYLPAVVLLWRLLNRGTGRGARVFLLCAGLLFCGWGSPWSLLMLCGEGAASFLLGRGMARPGAPRRLLLAVGAALLLAVLAFFKYTGFLLSLTPLEGLFSPPAGLMPLGLSFVTFQQLFWLRDCYFGEAGRESALDFACCLTFFATATCGPITRVGELAPQLRRPRALDWGDLAAGLYCFALGLAKKVLVASVFAQRADFGYANAGALTGVDSALTILCYTLQIYFDFSGYCDMAAGMARMMGIDLPVNFNSPYRALSVQEFWGRWHITLSRFFRSCLYIPLGGSRRGMAVTCRNIMIVFLLSGLWHGAGWGFVLWGGLHGAAMVAQRLWGRRKFLPKPLCWLLTFAFVNVAWVFFRAESLGQAGALLGDLFTGGVALPSAEFAAALSQQQLAQLLPALEGMLGPAGELLLYWLPLLAIPAGLALLACPNPLAQAERMRPTAARAVLTVACLVVSLVFFSGVDTFIYANF
ncbi:MAG TPA: MBOAT family protein [Candidatus Acutalibacter stercorigallinarum]|nr:MBOAT family protein [Candidatus Acutalibacter stercorigallinarum]